MPIRCIAEDMGTFLSVGPTEPPETEIIVLAETIKFSVMGLHLSDVHEFMVTDFEYNDEVIGVVSRNDDGIGDSVLSHGDELSLLGVSFIAE